MGTPAFTGFLLLNPAQLFCGVWGPQPPWAVSSTAQWWDRMSANAWVAVWVRAGEGNKGQTEPWGGQAGPCRQSLDPEEGGWSLTVGPLRWQGWSWGPTGWTAASSSSWDCGRSGRRLSHTHWWCLSPSLSPRSAVGRSWSLLSLSPAVGPQDPQNLLGNMCSSPSCLHRLYLPLMCFRERLYSIQQS